LKKKMGWKQRLINLQFVIITKTTPT